MRRGWSTVLAMVWAASAAPALAHPHVFIDAGVDVIFGPDGRAEALRDFIARRKAEVEDRWY